MPGLPGPWELILVLVIVLIIFGPGKLPDIGNAIGKGIREFRRASSDIEDAVRGDIKPEEKPAQPVEPVKRDPGEQTH
jgi:sec-independent protein translocase protein TatA